MTRVARCKAWARLIPLPYPTRRALKTKGNTPKYGLIFHSSFIGRAKQKNKGRISRYLANKCSIASRCGLRKPEGSEPPQIAQKNCGAVGRKVKA